MRLKIVQVGEPVLRQCGRDLSVEEILSQPIQQLIEMMRETMRDAPGVGLAAPQIGLSLQLAVIEDPPILNKSLSPEELAARERNAVPFHVIINPKITLIPEQTVDFYEGCLSLSGFTAIVPRALSVRVDCLNEKGEPQVINARGWYARILQHEIDHLNCTVYIDRMITRSFMSVENHARYWRSSTIEEIKSFLASNSSINIPDND